MDRNQLRVFYNETELIDRQIYHHEKEGKGVSMMAFNYILAIK